MFMPMKCLRPWNVCAHEMFAPMTFAPIQNICPYIKYLRHIKNVRVSLYTTVTRRPLKSSRPIKDVCARKCRRPNSYYLGSAESPTSDSFSVRLKSSLSDGVASPPCSPQVGIWSQTAQLIWAASLPYCTGLLYRHDLPEYSGPVKCSRSRIFPPFFWEKSKT